MCEVFTCLHFNHFASSSSRLEWSWAAFQTCPSSACCLFVLSGGSSVRQDPEPIPESGPGRFQSFRQTGNTNRTPLSTFDPQQTTGPLVIVFSYAPSRSASQGEHLSLVVCWGEAQKRKNKYIHVLLSPSVWVRESLFWKLTLSNWPSHSLIDKSLNNAVLF